MFQKTVSDGYIEIERIKGGHFIMTMKKNTTIVVLVAIIVSMFAINALAVNEVLDWIDHDKVTVLRQQIVGCYPYAEEATLKTSSTAYEHISIVHLGCFECAEEVVGWDLQMSPVYSLTPDRVKAFMEFPYSCFSQDNHCTAIFDADIE